MPATTGEHWGRWAILGAMALLLPVCGWGLSRIKAENNVEDWVGKDNIAAQKYAWYRQHFPGEDSLFVTWKDSRLDDPRLPRLIDQLLGPEVDGQRRGGFPEFASVKTPHEFIRRIEDSANLPRAEAVATLDGLLVGSGPVCVRLTSEARARIDTVGPLFEAELARLRLDAKVLAPQPRPEQSLSTTDTAYNHEELAETWALWEPHDLRISGPGLRPHRAETKRLLHRLREWRLPKLGGAVVERAFFLHGSPVALSIKLSPLGEENRTETFRKLRQTAVAVGIPDADLVLGGRAVTGSALNRAVMNAFWNHDAVWYRPYEKSLVLTCGAISGLLAFWILRSLRLATLVIGLAMYVTLVCMAVVPILGGVPEWEALTGSTGKMNLVLVVLPPLILVTTLSGSIHLVTYWRHIAAREPGGAVAKAVAAASRPCFWSSGTTALGLISLVVSTLQPIRDFGLYGSLGMMIALAAILYGLSALLHLIPLRTPSLEEVESPWWRRFGDLLTRWATPIVGGALVFGAVCALGLGRLRTETKPIRYFSNDSRIVQEYEWLEGHLAGVAPLQVVVRFDPAAQQDIRFLHRAEIVRHVQQSLREVPDVTGAISLADVLPRITDPGPEAPAGEQRMFLLKSKQIQERVARRAGTSALWKRALEPTRFNTAGDELWVISAHSLAMSETQYVDLSRDIETVCGQALQRALAAHPAEGPRDVSQTLTGVVPLFMATQDELLTSLWRSFLLASLTIGVTMMVQLRSITAGLLAMLPNVTPIAVVFGLAAWLGVALDIGTIVTASIAMGIAVDGTLHMINWFDQRLGQGLSRKQAAIEAVVHCGPAMWQTGLIVCAGMFVLWPSELMLISRFGVFMTAVVFTASVADTVFTPALLAGPLGWVLERKRNRESRPVKAADI